MDGRRLPLLLLLVLLPVPAQADRHNMECFGGASPEKRQALAARLSCGILVKSAPADAQPSPPPPPPPKDPRLPVSALGQGTASVSATRDAGAATAMTVAPGLHKRSLFAVGEVAEYITGNDSGRRLDGWMAGLRGTFRGQSSLEPFVHGLAGRQRPPRPDTVTTEDAPDTKESWAAAVGAGLDLELFPMKPGSIVPVLRVQLDVVKAWTNPASDPYGRITVGVSFRYEKD